MKNNYFSLLTSHFQIRKGFTLIELLVVISIIGILASFLTANFVGVRQRARDSQRKSDLRQIQSALELYRADQAGYPNIAALPACNTALSGGSPSVTYMGKVPCDPTDTSTKYTYSGSTCAGTTCAGYTLSACLENTNDPLAIGASCGTYSGKLMTVANP